MGKRGPGAGSVWLTMPPAPVMEDALCAMPGVDPEWWFEEAPRARRVEAAATCGGCPELAVCRDWALAQGDELRGTWGGLNRGQRRLIRKAVGDG